MRKQEADLFEYDLRCKLCNLEQEPGEGSRAFGVLGVEVTRGNLSEDVASVILSRKRRPGKRGLD